ncbi:MULTISPECIES: SGNH/GDSL hydrolase family protein [Dietzia]|uniref:SGNH/GDSL hydrolase family protein n=1 Tax=Dietzia TaxID=37914 RepID=UPI0033696AE7
MTSPTTTTRTALEVRRSAAAHNATYGPRGAGLGRAINRARAGGDLKFTCIGDSIFDKTTPGNTGGGPMEKTAVLVADRFGIEVTTANHAASGFTAARASIMGNVTSAINEQADVVFISLGKNDTGADSGSPYAPGHPRAASLAAIERMCAAIRRNSGRSDIVIICEGPYTANNTTANALLREHSDGLKKIAAVWGAELIDVYPAFTAVGDYSHLMYDSTHQNPAGNDLYAQAMLAHFPEKEFATVAAAAPSRRGMFDMTVVDHDAGNAGYIVRGASSVGALNGVTVTETGTGWSSQVTSTPGDAR